MAGGVDVVEGELQIVGFVIPQWPQLHRGRLVFAASGKPESLRRLGPRGLRVLQCPEFGEFFGLTP